MESRNAAYTDLQTLQQQAAAAQRQGAEAVKASFLGGMKDGESWGLRKWLSKHGQGLGACTNLECILTACRQLEERSQQERLARMLRPMESYVLQKLRSDIPSSYQKHSTAHPYLPYFHRLEAALRNMARYCQEEEDIICLDDSDDEDDVVEVVAPTSKKRAREDSKPAARKRQETVQQHFQQQQQVKEEDNASSSGESAGDEISVIGESPWPLPLDAHNYLKDAYTLGTQLFDFASRWDRNQISRPSFVYVTDFWRGENFGYALRLLSQLLQKHESIHLLDRVDDDECIRARHPPFSHIIKHPIALRDIADSLLLDQSGVLQDRTLDTWNMFNAKDLLQAIDLVFLNALAYTKVVASNTTRHRSLTNGLRRLLWNGIQAIGTSDKSDTPTRRTETSGFVIYKINTSRR